MHRGRIPGFVALGALLLATLVYTVDMRVHGGRVARNVTLAGEAIGGMPAAEVRDVARSLDRRYRQGEIRVTAPGGGVELTPAEIGLELDQDRTVTAALRAGREGLLPGRVASWVRSFVSERQAPARITLNEGALRRVLAEKDPGDKEEVVEPTIVLEEGTFTAIDGRAGRGIRPNDVADALHRAARHGAPRQVAASRGPIPPRFTLAQARRVAEQANALSDEPLPVVVGTVPASIPAATLRSWIVAEPGDEGLELGVDEAKVAADMEDIAPEAGERPVETTFRVTQAGLEIVPGRPGTVCCEPQAIEDLERAILDRPDQPVQLRLREAQPKLTPEEAAGLGVNEPVASFTTRFAAGQPRVRNIHRIADLVRGQVIRPGETFSVNGFVGRRTTGKGFVAAPVIEDGVFAEDVGGGISQFATTLFNAAFFAGLDFGEYQSHSIYISRYPYGREATLAYPHPDLQIRNTSPYGVLLWPTYSRSSITVTLYSTKHLEAAQSGQTREPRGVCTRVRTERTRTWNDGRREVDAVFALYRPGEGVDCSGNRTASATTTAPPAPTTTRGAATTAPPDTSPTTAPPGTSPTTAPPDTSPTTAAPDGGGAAVDPPPSP